MANESITHKLMAFSYNFEMLVRRVYRSKLYTRASNRFKGFKSKKNIKTNNIKIELTKLEEYLRKLGINDGDILIVHSALTPFKNSGYSPADIINMLSNVIGTNGTLAMPVIRIYKEAPPIEVAIEASIEDILFKYDVNKTKIWTGAIPTYLMKMQNSVTSRFPLNTMTANGPMAAKMMEGNIDGELPTPNGENSSWSFCADHNAWVISLGVDLTHNLTMIHTAEDRLKENWPIKNWYRKKRFEITDGDFKTEKIVLERHPKWGMLHYGERTLAKDLINNGIMQSTVIDGILIESLRSKELIDFLNSKNKNGYPYFWVKKYKNVKNS